MFESEILFTGYYGQLNTGDDAFVEVATWGASKYWGMNNNIFLSRPKNLPKIQRNIKGYPFDLPKTYRIQDRLLLSGTKYLISAGGSTIHSKMQVNNIKSLGVSAKNRGSKIKIGGIGVSIGPFKTIKDEKAVFEYLRKIDFLAVRDNASFDLIKDLDLPYNPVNAFDLAALLPEIYNKVQRNERQKKTIGISVCPVESIVGGDILKEDSRNLRMVELIKKIEKMDDVHFKFFIINGNSHVGDLSLTMQIIDQANPKSYELINYSKNTVYTWNEIGSCDFVLSTRLHAAIFSCFLNIPFMLNEYHRKCEDFLDDIGYMAEYRLFDNEYDIIEKANQIVDILNDKSLYQPPKFTQLMIEKARLNFTGVNV